MATIKQKKAFKAVVENGGNVSRAMLDVNYSPATAKTPQKLTESVGWQELLDEYLPERDLAKKHKELLNAVNLEKLSFNPRDTDEEIRKVIENMEGYTLLYIKSSESDGRITDKYAYVKAPDNMAQDKALDKAYKLKGSYAPEKTQALNVNIKGEIKDFNELDAVREKYEEELRRKLNQNNALI